MPQTLGLGPLIQYIFWRLLKGRVHQFWVFLNDAPRWYYPRRAKDLESPERNNGFFKPPRKWQSLSGLVLGSFHLSLQKTITPVMGLQILSPSRILLYQRRASFKITMLRLVNSSFKLLFGFVGKSLWFTLSQKETCLDFCTVRFIKPYRNPVYKCTGLR